MSGSQRLLAQPARCFKPFQSACRRLVVQPRAAAPAAAPVAADPVPVPAFKANLDFKYIKENLAAVTDNCKNRLSSAQPARVVELYDEFTQLKQEADRIRASRNENSQAMKVRSAAIGHMDPSACCRAAVLLPRRHKQAAGACCGMLVAGEHHACSSSCTA